MRSSSRSCWPMSSAARAGVSSRSSGPARRPAYESCSRSSPGSGARWHRGRGRGERFLHDAQHLLARAFGDRKQTAELEARKLHVSGTSQGLKAEVREKVRGKDRLVHLEALVLRLAFPVAVREGLQSLRATVAGIPDRCEEERLHHPRARRLDEVRARHEHRVGRGRAGRQLGGAREELRRAVLHRPEHIPVGVVVHGSPRPPLRLRLLDPLALFSRPAVTRLPPDAVVAHRRNVLQRDAGETGDTRPAHAGPISSTITSTASGSTFAIRPRYEATRRCTSLPTSGIDAPHSTARCSSTRTRPSSCAIRTPLCLWRPLSTSPRTPSTSRAASAA